MFSVLVLAQRELGPSSWLFPAPASHPSWQASLGPGHELSPQGRGQASPVPAPSCQAWWGLLLPQACPSKGLVGGGVPAGLEMLGSLRFPVTTALFLASQASSTRLVLL